MKALMNRILLAMVLAALLLNMVSCQKTAN